MKDAQLAGLHADYLNQDSNPNHEIVLRHTNHCTIVTMYIFKKDRIKLQDTTHSLFLKYTHTHTPIEKTIKNTFDDHDNKNKQYIIIIICNK